MVTFADATATGKQVVSDFSEKNVTLMAAGIAYNAFISLVPILLLLLLVVTVVGGGLEDRLLAVAEGSLPGPIANVIEQVFRGESAATGASFIGFVVLLWGSLKIFRGLDTAFSEIYDTEGANSFTDQVRDGLVVLVGLTVAIVATVGVSAVFSAFSDTVPFLGFVTPLVLVAGLILAFFPMYYVFPDADLDWRQAVPGTVFAAVGWAVLQALFQVYLTFKGGGSASFFGSVVVVITWLYFSGLVLLLGAVINSVVGEYSPTVSGTAGQDAASGNVQRETSLSGKEFAKYLRSLREELTGRYEGMRPISDDAERLPQPTGEVEVVERSVSTGDGEEWSVTLRWGTSSSGENKGSVGNQQ
ncbi:YihY/virulence factor BrkB family protein [Haladaptatus caseinilyticus]|uniref:YihY/virulence factor BrkB family protein n=1 Tax=Haladaptatus caseinilyticus TaxID=2993314 RepID=UPI00224B1FF2|nr:YihY/virulence factor BrkB family protein [Haladaptatus caseinilyticus]